MVDIVMAGVILAVLALLTLLAFKYPENYAAVATPLIIGTGLVLVAVGPWNPSFGNSLSELAQLGAASGFNDVWRAINSALQHNGYFFAAAGVLLYRCFLFVLGILESRRDRRTH